MGLLLRRVWNQKITGWDYPCVLPKRLRHGSSSLSARSLKNFILVEDSTHGAGGSKAKCSPTRIKRVIVTEVREKFSIGRKFDFFIILLVLHCFFQAVGYFPAY